MSLTYTHLISCEELHSIIDNANIVVLDATIPAITGMEKPLECWPSHRIMYAQFFDIENDFSDLSSSLPHTMPTAEQFQSHVRNLGINVDSQIVIYDCYGMFSSARAWWMFKAMGHKNVAVLNGGLPEWINHKFPMSNEAFSPSTGDFKAKFDDSKICSATAVITAIEKQNKTILDARGKARFDGTAPEPRLGVRAGHMPTALNLPYINLLKDGAMIEPELLKLTFPQGLDVNSSFIMSCGSGVTACILALAAEIIGVHDVCVYDGSWSEWGQDNRFPVITS